MAYQALYRKWRPDNFEDVVGQEPIITTLKNQIKKQQISHAYLFSGTRGTGKTTTAKIFARAVNCLNSINANPCNECEVCKGILSERIIDVLEIDAASNNGVDHIRELRENVKYAPANGKYKVYIIDEVHMLSGGAFNALLKTLEEPPPQVIFILATTEVHKLPTTILSRCQRFDFKPVKIEQMVERLRQICESMAVPYEEAALKLVAHHGRGALRDAISILEQCIGAGKGLSLEKVMETLGIASEEILVQLTEAIRSKGSAEALTLYQHLIAEGHDSGLLLKDLIQHFRKLLMHKLGVVGPELLFTEAGLRSFEEQAEGFTEAELTRCLYQLSESESKVKFAAYPQVIVEVLLVTLCRPEIDDSREGLIARIEALEAAIQSGLPVKAAAPPASSAPAIEHVLADIPVKYETEAVSSQATLAKEPSKEPQHQNEKASAQEETVSTGQDRQDLHLIQDRWEEILNELRQKKKAQIKAMLIEGRPVKLKNGILTIQFKAGFEFHRDGLEKDKSKQVLCQVIQEITGFEVALNLVMESQIDQKSDQPNDSLEQLKRVLPEGMLEVVDE